MGKPRLLLVDDIYCEAPLEGHITFLRNDDVPGMIGFVGRLFGDQDINIANFSVGRRAAGGEAISVIATDHQVPEDVLAMLLENTAVRTAQSVRL